MDGAFFQILFLSLTEIILLFSLLFGDMGNNTDGFLNVKSTLYFWNKLYLINKYYPYFCGIFFLIIIILLRIFSAMLMRATFCDFCYIYVWFWYQSNTGLILNNWEVFTHYQFSGRVCV